MSPLWLSNVLFHLLLFLLVEQRYVHCQPYYGSPQLQSSIAVQTSFPTVTVRGFLNFRTTVDGTVIVFTPSPNAGASQSSSSISTTVAPQIVPTTPPPAPARPEIRPTRPVQSYPTGLVTVLGGTVVQGGSTTVYETKVIGTYISGKYAQILSSTIRVRGDEQSVSSPTIRPTSTQQTARIVVQPTRTIPKVIETPKEDESTVNAITTKKHIPHQHIHPLRAKANKLMENSKASHRNARLALNPLKSRWAKPQLHDDQAEDQSESRENQSLVKIRKPRVGGSRRYTLPPRHTPKMKMNRFKSKLPATQAEEMQQYYSTKGKEETPEITAKSSIDQQTKEKILENLTPKLAETEMEAQRPQPTFDEPKSTDRSIKGNHLQIKTLTTTTTIERAIHPTESEFDTNLVKPTIDISVNDLEATSIPETPALVMTRTYSITERTMRTTVVPVFDGTATQSHTVTESFFIRKLITAYRTLPPGDMIMIEATQTQPSALNTELINGTEMIGDLSMAEQGILPSSVEGNIQPTEMPSLPSMNMETSLVNQPLIMPSIDPSLTMGLITSPQQQQQQPMFPPSQFAQKFDLNNPLLLAAVLQNPQLAAVYLGLQQMKQQQQQQQQQQMVSQQYNTITKPTQVLQTETIYNTKLISFYDGRQTRTRTILEPAGTTEKMIQTITTQLVPMMNNLAMQQAQLQNVFASQLGMMPQFQITPTIQSTTSLKTVTTVTEATITKSKVYTLVYNALSTRYRTITSTNVQPTTITTVLTETFQLQPTQTPNQMNFFG
ncbi:hypothetical protein BLOT_005538 [Blomia tropicalis]|nr:hypothetical protein BLOT_005538 [Blomia tropicalis]